MWNVIIWMVIDRMKDFKFKVEKVDTLPDKTYTKGSKFDHIIKSFIESKHEQVKLTVPEFEGKASYLANRINQRNEVLKTDVVAIAINGNVYLAYID